MTLPSDALDATRPRLPLSLRVSHLLLKPFTTLWALAYYIAYYRNPVYLTLVALAVAVDCARQSPGVSSRVFRQIEARKAGIIAIIVLAFAVQCWTVVIGRIDAFAFIGPYRHFAVAVQSTPVWYAATIYVLESAGALSAFLIIAHYAIRLAAPEAEPVLIKTEQRLARANTKFEQRKLPLFFILLYALQISVAAIAIRKGTPRPHEYHPQTSAIEMALFSVAPVFFAVAMKAWLREVVALLRRARHH